jgi:SET domain-containing protein
MRYAHSNLIEVRQARKKGRGVFARRNIRRGTVIERVPVVVMRVQEIFSKAPRTTLVDYVFSWGHGKVAFACG